RSAVRPRAVIEMLTLSPVFPRSIRFAIGEVDAALARIAAHQAGLPAEEGYGAPGTASGRTSEAERAVGRLRGTLAYQRVDEVFALGVRDYLRNLQSQCNQIGERIEAQYFAGRVLRGEEVVA